MSEKRLVTIEVDGEEFEVDALEWEDPGELMLDHIELLEGGRVTALYGIVRLLGVNPDGWRISKVRAFLEALKAATEMDLGESSGSGKSSGATKQK